VWNREYLVHNLGKAQLGDALKRRTSETTDAYLARKSRRKRYGT